MNRNLFKITMHAENLNRLQRYEDTIKLLTPIEVPDNDKSKMHLEYRLAEAMYGLGVGYMEQALEHISKACELCNDKYLATYEALRAEVLFAINKSDDRWKQSIEKAICLAKSEKYKNELICKYEEMRAKKLET